MKLKVNFAALFLLLVVGTSVSFAQSNTYSYQRELKGVSDQWHRIELPNEIFGKLSPDFPDIRILGITGAQDTVEAPYILRQASEKISETVADFKIINQSQNDQGYFYTFEMPVDKSINEVRLAFEQTNFDWRVSLEGGQHQQDWYSLLQNYRIVSIKNNRTDYQFTDLMFADARYRYYRLYIKSDEKPELTNAKLLQKKVSDGRYRDYNVKKLDKAETKSGRQNIVNAQLDMPVPVTKLHINISSNYDYYRPVLIQFAADSFKTEKGWNYNYRTLASGTLSSLGDNTFKFDRTILKKIKVTVSNNDNEPLSVKSVKLEGPVQELIARFNEPANYYLVYGNAAATRPNYDIDYFENRIPDTIKSVKVGKEEQKAVKTTETAEPLFIDKAWLWSIMGVIIIVLGWLTIKMLTGKA